MKLYCATILLLLGGIFLSSESEAALNAEYLPKQGWTNIIQDEDIVDKLLKKVQKELERQNKEEDRIENLKVVKVD